jgi:hypothetical protein
MVDPVREANAAVELSTLMFRLWDVSDWNALQRPSILTEGFHSLNENPEITY